MRTRSRVALVACASLWMIAFAESSAVATVPAEALTASSSSTVPEEFSCSARFRVYDPIELTRLFFLIPHFDDCRTEIPGAIVRKDDQTAPTGWVVENLPSGFHGPADIVTCESEVPHFECQPTLDLGEEIVMTAAEGPSGPPEHLPTICPVFIDCERWPCESPGPYFAQICGDADGNSRVSALDALIVLRGAVDISDCPSVICDVDWSDDVTATDALSVLKTAVGLHVTLACPAPCTNLSFP